jgi:hypothetical protein
MIRAGALLVAAIALSACSSAAPIEENGGAAVAPGGTAIAKVVTRDRSITLTSGDGVRATVFDGAGRMIARDIPIDSLQNVDATSYEATHWSVAGGNRAEPHPVPWNK